MSAVQQANAEADRAEARQALLVFAYSLRGLLFSAMVVWAYCAAGTRREPGELLLVFVASFLGSIAVDALVRFVVRVAGTD